METTVVCETLSPCLPPAAVDCPRPLPAPPTQDPATPPPAAPHLQSAAFLSQLDSAAFCLCPVASLSMSVPLRRTFREPSNDVSVRLAPSVFRKGQHHQAVAAPGPWSPASPPRSCGSGSAAVPVRLPTGSLLLSSFSKVFCATFCSGDELGCESLAS